MAETTWILTYTGRQFDLAAPRAEDVCVEDVAHALSLLCRYTGHCRWFYSVAQHSVLVSRIVPKELALEGLMHDAAEAYTGDMSRPLKNALWRIWGAQPPKLEQTEAIVAEAFGAAPAEEVRKADRRMFATEIRDVMVATEHGQAHADAIARPYALRVRPWSPAYAERMFLERYEAVKR